jgi:hypothetical protein
VEVTRPGRLIAGWLRLLIASIAALGLAGCLFGAVSTYFDPGEPLQRLRGPVGGDRIRETGRVHGLSASHPPLCVLTLQHYTSCGKSSCWRTVRVETRAQGRIELASRSAPLQLTPRFEMTPTSPPSASWSTTMSHDWGSSWRPSYPYRALERCVAHGEEITVDGCVESGPGADSLDSCGQGVPYAVVLGPSVQPALDDAANLLMYRFAGAALLALVIAIMALPRPELLADALAARAGEKAETPWLPIAAIGAAPVAFLIWHLLARNGDPTSTWSWGRGGYVLASVAIASWLISGLVARARVAQLRAATRPVVSTPRSLLSRAQGTVELHVRAGAIAEHDAAPAPIVVTEPVVFAEAAVRESIREGKSTTMVYRLTTRNRDSVRVSDESGYGTLDLRHAVLDLSTHEKSWVSSVPGLDARQVALAPQGGHQRFEVTEKVIRPGEELYVFGEVSGMTLSPSEHGYRTVAGSPTLGGSHAPLLVYAGTARGLVEALEREANARLRHAIGAAVAVALVLATWAWVASF